MEPPQQNAALNNGLTAPSTEFLVSTLDKNQISDARRKPLPADFPPDCGLTIMVTAADFSPSHTGDADSGNMRIYGVTTDDHSVLVHAAYPINDQALHQKFVYDCQRFNWINISKDAAVIRRPPHQIESTCQVEIDCKFSDISHVDPGATNAGAVVAPLRIMCLYITTEVEDEFGLPADRPIIQIGCMLKLVADVSPCVQVLFCLNQTAAIIPNNDDVVIVKCYASEVQLLYEWSQFVSEMDPDIFTGYNIKGSEFPVIINRCHKLILDNVDNGQILAQLEQVLCFGRLRDVRVESRSSSGERKNNHRVTDIHGFIPGRIVVDMQYLIMKQFKEMEANPNPRLNAGPYRYNKSKQLYTLKNVSRVLLQVPKEELKASQVLQLYKGTEEERRKLAIYVLYQVWLPLQLFEAVQNHEVCVQPAQATNVLPIILMVNLMQMPTKTAGQVKNLVKRVVERNKMEFVV